MERTILVIVLLAVGYAIVYFLLKRKIARSLNPASILEQVRAEVDRILVELNQTTNRNITLIEDRIQALTDLLAKADKKLSLLRREAEKQEGGAKLYSELAARRREEPEQASPPAARAAEALRLAQAGLSPGAIARRLAITVGEVELILSLAERRR